MENYYEVLGVDPTASPHEIRAAYLELAKKYHPDQNPSRIATRLMSQINRAYEVLRNSTSRAEYDRKVRHAPFSSTGPAPHEQRRPDRPSEQQKAEPSAQQRQPKSPSEQRRPNSSAQPRQPEPSESTTTTPVATIAVLQLLLGGFALIVVAVVLVLGTNAITRTDSPSSAASPPSPPPRKPVRVDEAVTKAAALRRHPEPLLPVELVEAAATLVHNKVLLRERRAAALKVLSYKPEDKVATYLRTIAELETARSCKARKASFAVMVLTGDPRYLPTLRRYDRSPHNGCGYLRLSDCYDCIRADVREALDEIELANPGARAEVTEDVTAR